MPTRKWDQMCNLNDNVIDDSGASLGIGRDEVYWVEPECHHPISSDVNIKNM